MKLCSLIWAPQQQGLNKHMVKIGNITILTIVYHFSKLLEALETAGLLTQHVFRLDGLYLDTVSVRGPQFTSQVWKASHQALGVWGSLSSGYHPQADGQAEWASQNLEAALRCSKAVLPEPSTPGGVPWSPWNWEGYKPSYHLPQASSLHGDTLHTPHSTHPLSNKSKPVLWAL